MAKVQIDVGGTGSGSYTSGSGLFTGGADTSTANAIITTGVGDPAPTAVYQAVRFDATSFSRTLTGLTVGETYHFRVHSVWHSTSYSFRTKANSVDKGTLSFVSGTDDNVVKVLEFSAVPDGSGNIALVFEAISTFALVAALQYWKHTGGSTVPADITGFTATAELAAGVTLDWAQGSDDLEIDHYRIERATDAGFTTNLTTINTPGPYYNISYFESLDPTTHYYYRIKGVDGDGNLSANWATDDVITTAAIGKINCGGGATGAWIADTFYTVGGSGPVTGVSAADTTGLTNPADAAVYTTYRGATSPATPFSYHITGVRANASYLIRLHFNLDVVVFDQVIQGNGVNATQVTYDVANKARIREFYLDADSDGILHIEFVYNFGNNVFVSGIEFELQDPPTDKTDLNIVILGDSITQGHPYYENCYPFDLADLLNATHINKHRFASIVNYDAAARTTVTNLGIAGDTLANMASRFTNDVVARFNPNALNIFVLLGGSNDLAGGLTAANIKAAIVSMCADAKTAGYDFCIACTITPRSDVTGANETKRTDANTLILAGDASYDAVVDIAADATFANTASAYYSAEAVKVHYSATGNAAAAAMFFTTITGLALTVPKTLHLEWVASTDNVAVTGYELLRATDSGFTTDVVGPTSTGNVIEYDVDLTITADTTFYLKLRAKDAIPNRSAYCTPVNIPVTLF